MELNEVKDKLVEARKRFMTLDWDKSMNQLNSGMQAKYIQAKEEYEQLQKKVEEMTKESSASQ